MKKILKKEVIIAFIIGVLIASGITVYAYSYFAKDISYIKPGTDTSISVEQALNELYSIQKGVNSNSVIEEITRNTSSVSETTITNVNNYKYYYVTNMWYRATGFNYSEMYNKLSVSSTNSTIIHLGDSCYNGSNKGSVSRGYLIFPDGSGNNIVISIQADGMTLYGIK